MGRVRQHGFGRFPVLEVEEREARGSDDLVRYAAEAEAQLPQGNRRSYGDACLFRRVTRMTPLDRVLGFDSGAGLLRAEAGITVGEIVRRILPHGWFLPVTPGTRHATLGGCVSADVHGKNHHYAGSFGRYVEEMEMVLAGGERVRCSPTERPDLFEAAIGGMGLLGFIHCVTLRLLAVPSACVRRRSIRAANLEEACALLEDPGERHAYTVAWIDALARGGRGGLGRGVVHLGDHVPPDEAPPGDPLRPVETRPRRVPVSLVRLALGRPSVRMANALVFRRRRGGPSGSVIPLDRFFYPLDRLAGWNLLYGRRGFLQYQVAVPRRDGPAVMREILERTASRPPGAYLAVLKNLGGAEGEHRGGLGGGGPLSFPLPGYTLALDLPLRRGGGVVALLRSLDRTVLGAGGRVYLAKDAILQREVFEGMYPRLAEFRGVKERYDPEGRFRSHLSERLGIT